MSDCIFCKIVAGQVPCHKIYENDFVMAFLDIFPHAKGHTVIIPKKHFSALNEWTAEEWQKFSESLRLVSELVRRVLKPDGMNIGVNDQPAAGQVVPHVHWHIFPRWEGDGGGSVHSIIKNHGEMSAAEVAKLFQM